MRRGVGIAGLQRQAAQKEIIKEVGKAALAEQFESFKTQLENFKEQLKEFAVKHKRDLKKDPVLRNHFQKMCLAAGIDPLASSKGFWTDLLGVGDFYYELGIQIIECCLIWQERTGGLIDFDLIKQRIAKVRVASTVVSDDDIQRAVSSLKPLQSGYNIIEFDGRGKVLQCLPFELSTDGTTLLSLAQTTARITRRNVDWSQERFIIAINGLIKDGIAWIDDQEEMEVQEGGGERTEGRVYWFPCFHSSFSPE